MKFFGERFPDDNNSAPIYDFLEEVPVPVGQECAWCTYKIKKSHRGYLIHMEQDGEFAWYAWHMRCFLRSILGFEVR